MAGAPPYAIAGSDTVQAAIKTKAVGNFADLYSKLDPALAVGTYADLPTRLAAYYALIEAAGAGTALVKVSSTEPSTPADGLVWIDVSSDPLKVKVRDETNTNWITLFDLTNDAIVAGDITFSGTTEFSASIPTLPASDPSSDNEAARKAYVDATASAAADARIVVAPILTPVWQTNRSEYPVQVQDIDGTDGYTPDSFPRYVMPDGVLSMMYTEMIIPVGGFNWQMLAKYRMDSAAVGNIYCQLSFRVISDGEAAGEIADWTTFYALRDSQSSIVKTPSATANVWNSISGTDFVIPSTSYSAGDMLQLVFFRNGSHADDTHTGAVEMCMDIKFIPVLP